MNRIIYSKHMGVLDILRYMHVSPVAWLLYLSNTKILKLPFFLAHSILFYLYYQEFHQDLWNKFIRITQNTMGHCRLLSWLWKSLLKIRMYEYKGLFLHRRPYWTQWAVPLSTPKIWLNKFQDGKKTDALHSTKCYLLLYSALLQNSVAGNSKYSSFPHAVVRKLGVT